MQFAIPIAELSKFGTGLAATQVFNLNSDGLGNKIIGTGFNCSGGTSPWGVTDMSTEAHNGFTTGAIPEPLRVDHRVVDANSPSTDDSNFNVRTSDLIGVFGNNFLFFIPTSGPDAGEVVPFAYGPQRCELTGPTFVGDTLIIAVQHPSEDVPFTPRQTLSREIEILNLDGTLFTQQRNIPCGSNWPSNIEGNLEGSPRPGVIGIRRKQSSGRFV